MDGDPFSATAADLGNGGIQIDGKVFHTFQKSFVQVQNILDHNRILIHEINQNHESKIPDNLTRNVGLIKELNNNIRRVVGLYGDLSNSFSKSMEAASSVGGDSTAAAAAAAAALNLNFKSSSNAARTVTKRSRPPA